MRGEVISVLSLERRYHILSKYDIVTRAIKLILPSLECDNLFITYLCLYLEQKPDYIFKLFILRVHFKMNSKLSLSILQSDAIFVLSGTKNDITGQKTISRDISFLCHCVIAQMKAQVCDIYIYILYDIG